MYPFATDIGRAIRDVGYPLGVSEEIAEWTSNFIKSNGRNPPKDEFMRECKRLLRLAGVEEKRKDGMPVEAEA